MKRMRAFLAVAAFSLGVIALFTGLITWFVAVMNTVVFPNPTPPFSTTLETSVPGCTILIFGIALLWLSRALDEMAVPIRRYHRAKRRRRRRDEGDELTWRTGGDARPAEHGP